MKNKTNWLRAGLLIWALLAIFPMAWFAGLNTGSNAVFNSIFGSLWMHVVSHGLIYAVLAAGLYLALPAARKQPLLLAGILLAVALLQEGFQKVMGGLPFSWDDLFDLGVDSVGSLIGWFIIKRVFY